KRSEAISRFWRLLRRSTPRNDREFRSSGYAIPNLLTGRPPRSPCGRRDSHTERVAYGSLSSHSSRGNRWQQTIVRLTPMSSSATLRKCQVGCPKKRRGAKEERRAQLGMVYLVFRIQNLFVNGQLGRKVAGHIITSWPESTNDY